MLLYRNDNGSPAGTRYSAAGPCSTELVTHLPKAVFSQYFVRKKETESPEAIWINSTTNIVTLLTNGLFLRWVMFKVWLYTFNREPRELSNCVFREHTVQGDDTLQRINSTLKKHWSESLTQWTPDLMYNSRRWMFAFLTGTPFLGNGSVWFPLDTCTMYPPNEHFLPLFSLPSACVPYPH